MTTKSKLTDTEREILTAVRDRMTEVAALPDPPNWKHWQVEELRELREYGPRYAPADWFGGGNPLPEKVRVRYLRAINKLMDTGFLDGTTTDGGRLAWLKLTPAGEQAITGGK
ncbi:hypothetical protein J8F10_15615 [Gemmata sp. G18]|uniref:TubC N-terminal docking domain-containing protein n=1 Tax=Gemmata palustris TaxID=2822762 RepID=A0ABS5BSH9_9BACT|nr:hypothetical protein [Gemmata palustris]MBP3956702.1 hypothetical protein [Gemmata palustris]